jgi:hypothetical protein
MAVSVPSTADMKKAIPSLGTPAWVATIGIIAAALLLMLAFGFKPLNLK